MNKDDLAHHVIFTEEAQAPGCPSWHFLPGPYQLDDERTDCPDRATHADQRRAWDRKNVRSITRPTDG